MSFGRKNVRKNRYRNEKSRLIETYLPGFSHQNKHLSRLISTMSFYQRELSFGWKLGSTSRYILLWAWSQSFDLQEIPTKSPTTYSYDSFISLGKMLYGILSVFTVWVQIPLRLTFTFLPFRVGKIGGWNCWPWTKIRNCYYLLYFFK